MESRMSAEPSSSSKPRRQLVKAACQSCQKRKVKCSGERPSCTLCQTRGQTCTYDSEAGITRVEAVRRRNKELVDQIADYELVYNTLQTTPEIEAFDHLRRLRGYTSVEEYAQVLKSALPSKRRPSNRTDVSLDGNGPSQLSPRSTHSQEGIDGDLNASEAHLDTTDYLRSNLPQSMAIDPQLESQMQSSMNFPQGSGSYMQSMTDMWSLPEEVLEQQRGFLPNTHTQIPHTQGYGPYDMELSQTDWMAGMGRDQAQDNGRRRRS